MTQDTMTPLRFGRLRRASSLHRRDRHCRRCNVVRHGERTEQLPGTSRSSWWSGLPGGPTDILARVVRRGHVQGPRRQSISRRHRVRRQHRD
jgi:hypothetical protein